VGREKHDAETARYWQQRLGEAVRSGISIREFCWRRRLKESQFYWWQRRLRLGRREGAGYWPGVNGPAASFALVSVAGGAAEARIELVLSGGQRLRITKGVDEPTLRTVLGALQPQGDAQSYRGPSMSTCVRRPVTCAARSTDCR